MKEITIKAYVCENCGVIHETEDEIMSFDGIEFCSDCIDFYDVIWTGEYGFIVVPKAHRKPLGKY